MIVFASFCRVLGSDLIFIVFVLSQDASRELGESVIGKCGGKLKQYLLREIQASGVPLSHDNKIVASVCNTRSEIDESSDLNACRQVCSSRY